MFQFSNVWIRQLGEVSPQLLGAQSCVWNQSFFLLLQRDRRTLEHSRTITRTCLPTNLPQPSCYSLLLPSHQVCGHRPCSLQVASYIEQQLASTFDINSRIQWQRCYMCSWSEVEPRSRRGFCAFLSPPFILSTKFPGPALHQPSVHMKTAWQTCKLISRTERIWDNYLRERCYVCNKKFCKELIGLLSLHYSAML
jgi:hypothetical protein